MKPTVPLLLVLTCSCSTADYSTSDSSHFNAKLAQAKQLIEAQEYDEALMITDEVIEAEPTNHRARMLAADGNIGIFNTGRSGSAFLLDDAITDLQSALGIKQNDPDTWLRLSRYYYLAAKFERGISAGERAAKQYADSNADQLLRGQAFLAVADCQLQMFIALRNEELAAAAGEPSDPGVAVTDSANIVLTTLNYAERAGTEAGANQKAAQVYQWLGRMDLALDALERGIDAEPGDAAIHTAYQNMCFSLDLQSECVGTYRKFLRKFEGNTTVQWFLGRAEIARGDDARSQGQWEEAARQYRSAEQSFASFKAKQPSNTGVDHWLAICELSLGAVVLETGDLETAARHYDAAFEHAPAVVEQDENGFLRVFDSFGGNYLTGIDKIAQAYAPPADQLDEKRQTKALAFYDVYLERHGKPKLFGPIYNNAAFLARDLGVAISGQGQRGQPTAASAAMSDEQRREAMTKAMGLWEKSYRYYETAVELSPDDPRIVNDCGLMLIYHLHRDYDRAEELFRNAIEIGQPMIDALEEDADEAEREFLEEAVGDAYENMGVLFNILNKTDAEIRPWIEEAVKLFPYQRRQAARILRRMNGGGDEATSAADHRRRQDSFQTMTEEARVKAAEDDFDGALLILDGLAKDYGDHAPYHALAGSYAYSYAEQALANGSSAALIDGLYGDAERELKRAIVLDPDPIEPHLVLSEAFMALAKDRESAREADHVVASLVRTDLARTDRAEALARAHKLRAEAATRAYVAAKQQGKDPVELLDMARASYNILADADDLNGHQLDSWTSMEQWAGANAKALDIVERRLGSAPGDQDLLARYVELGKPAKLGERTIEFLASAQDATTIWYRGMARYHRSQAHWARSKYPEAILALSKAMAEFELAQATNPEFETSCQQWISICNGAVGIVEISREDAEAGQKALLHALEIQPDGLNNIVGGGRTLKQGIMLAGDKFYKADDLGKVTEIYAAASKLAPSDVDFANNYGLFARDYAIKLRREDKESPVAKEMFEASYAAYSLAAELDPSSLRLKNDKALLLIYYLKRDYTLAHELLVEALSEGEKLLADNPPGDATELQDLQEAVGDCHQNLGVYFRNVIKYNVAARAAFEKSLTFYPFEKRSSTRHLRRMDKLEKGEDLSEEEPKKEGKPAADKAGEKKTDGGK